MVTQVAWALGSKGLQSVTDSLRTKTHMTSSRCLPPAVTAASRCGSRQEGTDVTCTAAYVWAVAGISAQVKAGAA